MTDYKYKITIQDVVGGSSTTRIIETSDIDLVRELTDLPVKKVEVNTPNESIDTDWQSILVKLSKQFEETKQKEDKGGVVPIGVPASPSVVPLTPYIVPDWWKETQENQRKFDPPFTVTC